jgi:dephospho-CoA kinase
MVKVGITGGIGSGKTTVCKVWESMGAVVVYADDLAKKLMVDDDELITKVISEFGELSYHEDGTLNRQYLATKAFKKGEVEKLNKIVHPAVARKVQELMERAEAQGADLFAEEAALLLSKGRPEIFDYIVIVTADKTDRLKWVKKRDGSGQDEIIARMRKQQSFEELMPLCDFVIENDSTVHSLKRKAEDLYRQMLKLQNTGVD